MDMVCVNKRELQDLLICARMFVDNSALIIICKHSTQTQSFVVIEKDEERIRKN